MQVRRLLVNRRERPSPLSKVINIHSLTYHPRYVGIKDDIKVFNNSEEAPIVALTTFPDLWVVLVTFRKVFPDLLVALRDISVQQLAWLRERHRYDLRCKLVRVRIGRTQG